MTTYSSLSQISLVVFFHVISDNISESDEVPSRGEIEVAERYFEKCVAPLGNELAVIAFANACRSTSMGTFTAMTQIMEAQMVN